MADRDGPNYGQIFAGCSAILLSYLMLFDWFGEEPSQEPAVNLPGVGHSAWEALNYLPILLLVTIVAALTAPLLHPRSRDSGPFFPINAIVGILGIVSVVFILFRVLDPPNFDSEPTSFGTVVWEGTVQLPIFLALAAAAGIATGGFWALREDSIRE